MTTTMWRNYMGTIFSDGRILIKRVVLRKSGAVDRRYKGQHVLSLDNGEKDKRFRVIQERLRFANACSCKKCNCRGGDKK